VTRFGSVALVVYVTVLGVLLLALTLDETIRLLGA
jgi:hypothetical protein